MPELSTRVVPALVGFIAVGALAADSGGYFPTAWGWSALAFFSLVGVTIAAASTIALSRLELLFAAGLAAFAGWIAASIAWSGTPDTVLEVQRALVYVAGTLAVLLVLSRRAISNLLGAMLAAIVLASAYGLATRLLPDRLGVFDAVAASRLSAPLGYWNALGIFAAIGSLLALGFAARARALHVRALAAAAPVVLVPTLYFTFGRGAWIAFALGIVAAVALDPRRLQLTTVLLVLAPAPALAVWLGSRSRALTHTQLALPPAAVHDGHRLAVVVLVLATGTAAAMVILAVAEGRITVPPIVRSVYALVLVLALALALGSVFVRYGGPATIAKKAYGAFKAPPVGITRPGASLNKRLFSFSGNGRYVLWRTAWRDHGEHPLLGSGAGTFERYWLRHRTYDGNVRDAHSLYFETLAELGPPGLALLVLTLAVPLAAGVRARHHPLVPAVLGAYVAYVVHAGVDWDWEMTVVTLTGLFCGAAVLVAARRERPRAMPAGLRAGGLVVVLALAVFAYVGLRGNRAIAASERAAESVHWRRTAGDAREAERWAPWSARAKQLLGEAQGELGNVHAARATLSQAIGMDAGDWTLWKDLALASRGRAQRRAFAAAGRLNPLDPVVAQYRAALKVAAGSGK